MKGKETSKKEGEGGDSLEPGPEQLPEGHQGIRTTRSVPLKPDLWTSGTYFGQGTSPDSEAHAL